jgi:hypothetical protein
MEETVFVWNDFSTAKAHAIDFLKKLKKENPDPAGEFWNENDPIFEIWSIPRETHLYKARIVTLLSRADVGLSYSTDDSETEEEEEEKSSYEP